MKTILLTLAAFFGGCVLWWISVELSGFLAAIPWPAFVVDLSKSSKLQAQFFWQVAIHFVPIFLVVGVASYGIFRLVGSNATAFVAALLPYLLLSFAMGSIQSLFQPSAVAIYALILIAQVAFPLGVTASWAVARRKRAAA